jgi:hypothetical protein
MRPRVWVCVLTALAWPAVATGAGAARAQEQDALRWLSDAAATLSRVESYTATFHKQERVSGELLPEETVYLKFRRPRMIHMRWIRKPFVGREALYIEGRNENRLRVREGGLLGLIPVNLDPHGGMAMKGNRHSIVEAGIEQLITRVADNVRRGQAAGELEVRVGGEEQVFGRRSLRLEGVFPKSGADRYYCHRAVLSFDVEKKVPILVSIYDWDDALVECYGYENLALDAGLSEADFALGRK